MIHRDQVKRWFIQLPGRERIFADKNGRTFYFEEQARWILAQVQGEIENGKFDADLYFKHKKSTHSFEVYALEWLAE